MTPEGKVKAQVKRLLDKFAERGLYYFFVPQNGYGRAGVPDIVGCFMGQFFAVECKAGKGTTTALQDKELEKIEAAEGKTFVIREDNIKELGDWLDTML